MSWTKLASRGSSIFGTEFALDESIKSGVFGGGRAVDPPPTGIERLITFLRRSSNSWVYVSKRPRVPANSSSSIMREKPSEN